MIKENNPASSSFDSEKKTDQFLSDYSIKIKDVLIELEDYEYFHSPEAKDERLDLDRFIGRQKIIRRLTSLLENSATQSGSYLITGFRGMGKTSVVRKVIKKVNRKKEPKGIKNKTKRNHSYFFYQLDDWYTNLFGFIRFAFMLISILFFLLLIPTVNTLVFFNLDFVNPIQWFKYIRKGSYYFTTVDFFNVRAVSFLILSWVILSLIILSFDVLWYSIRFILKKRYPTLWKRKYPYLKPFEINLSQDEVRVKEVLRQVTIQLYNYWNTEIECVAHRLDRRVHMVWWPFIWMFKRTVPLHKISFRTVSNKLQLLKDRLLAEVTFEKEQSNQTSVSNFIGIFRGSLGFKVKNQLNFPIATTKEVESELIGILEDMDSLRKRTDIYETKKNQKKKFGDPINYWFKLVSPEYIPRFVFVIDELDKIEPNSTATIRDRESSDPYFDQDHASNDQIFSTSKVRQRQEAIARLLANLKGFLNVARAKFIFIGGREMYDAFLADIADRDAFYNSIFHDVIYVNSFFKDKLNYRSGVTRMTEAYLCNLIIPNSFIQERLDNLKGFEVMNDDAKQEVKEGLYTLKTYYDYLVQHLGIGHEEKKINFLPDRAKAFKVIGLLQNYIIYLTYRSNGSPKKLSNLIESLISNVKPSILEEDDRFLIIKNTSNPISSKSLYLRFSFNAQYEIGLTSNIYRPYLINKSRINKSLGDKLLFSSAFIIDHILKFHSFGFSWRNLELIPEVILVNKEPNLRGFIAEIVQFLSMMHIRRTVTGIFQYKFFNKVRNELTLLSKISELGSAAFNFTLDESLQIKRHYKRKLGELESKYLLDGGKQFNHSIALIQTILGDLHFYDKEYDDAILFYSQSMEALRTRNSMARMTKHQFLIWVRNKLRIGLTLEKMRAFDSAYSYYRKLIVEIPNYLKDIVDENFELPSIDEESPIPPSYQGVRPYRSLQMLILPFVSCLALVEKQRIDGLNIANLRKNEREMNQLFGSVLKGLHTGKEDEKFVNTRIYFLRASYFNSVGGILYYKNKPFDDIIGETSTPGEIYPEEN